MEQARDSTGKKKKHRGCVYIPSNPTYPNLFKIGYTSKNAKDRANEINTTGVPTPFEVEYEAFVKNPKKTERKVHKLLKQKRKTNNREFFECSLDEAIAAIKCAIGSKLVNEYYNSDKRSLAGIQATRDNTKNNIRERFDFADEYAKTIGYEIDPVTEGELLLLSRKRGNGRMSIYSKIN